MLNIYKYLGKSFRCGFCGRIHNIPVRAIEKGNIEKLGEFVSSLLPEVKSIVLLTDNIVWDVIGKRCKEVLEDRFYVIPHILSPSGEKRVTAKEEYMDGIVRALRKADAVITAGTGTITDLGKYAGDISKKPVISIPSAPSMNAYTSGVAAVIKRGVKTTFSVSPALGVFIDESILTESPIELIKAGFADSCAKAFANADWKLSSIITGDDFCELPLRIVSESEKRYIEKGHLLLKRDREIISSLMEGLNLGGISMVIAGSSSPASGGEHLISHFLDMYAHQNKREIFSYHGLQVGTGIYISAVIYEYLNNLSSGEVKKLLLKKSIDYGKKMEQLRSIFPSSAALIEEELKKKVVVDKKIKETLPDRWDEIKKDVFPLVYSPSEVKRFLSSAGCPLSMRDIGVDKKLAFLTLTLSRFIRGRLVILDIADNLGILEEIGWN